jgi:hypothetical protein
VNDCAPASRQRTADTGTGSAAAFNVVIAYDSRAAGVRGMNLFKSLVHEMGGQIEVHCELWRFDVLALEEAREAALRAGRVADLIIISVRDHGGLPPSVKDWLDRCVGGRAAGALAIAGLLTPDEGAKPSAKRTRQYLEHLGDRNLLRVFLDPAIPPGSASGSPVEEVRNESISASRCRWKTTYPLDAKERFHP